MRSIVPADLGSNLEAHWRILGPILYHQAVVIFQSDLGKMPYCTISHISLRLASASGVFWPPTEILAVVAIIMFTLID